MQLNCLPLVLQDFQKKRMLPIGFTIIILVMIATSVFSMRNMKLSSESFLKIAVQQEQTIGALREMSEFRLQRTVILSKMIEKNDPFFSDESDQELRELATDYIQTRDALLAFDLGAEIRERILSLNKITAVSGPIQYKVHELILNDKVKEASVLFFGTIIPQQDAFFNLINEIQSEQRLLSKKTLSESLKVKQESYNNIILLDFIAISSIVLLFIYLFAQEQRKTNRLSHLAVTDSLTQLPNRSNFLSEVSNSINKSYFPLAVIFVDIDFFKSINDNYGHEAGDEILKKVGTIISCNKSEQDILSRFGGDEFVVLLRSIKTSDTAHTLVEKLSKALDTSVTINDREIFITASIGASLIEVKEMEDIDASTLLKNADIAMYAAKEGGRNCFKFFSEDVRKRMEREHYISYKLLSLMKNKVLSDEFYLLYQPLIDLQTGLVRGCEALLRWKTKEGEIISPSEFIPVAEKTSLAEQINIFVIKNTCKQQYEWTVSKMKQTRININLSGNKESFIFQLDLLMGEIQKYNLSPKLFGIELTERTLFDLTHDTVKKLENARLLGLKISIDDFGTGFSSLSYLKNLPITTIKIDQTFIADLSHNKNDHVLVKAIIQLGKSLGLDVIAEGVETKEQIAFLKEYSCTLAQGFYYHNPLKQTDLQALQITA